MKASVLMIIISIFSISCNKEEEPIFPEGQIKFPGRYGGFIYYYSEATGDISNYNIHATVNFVDKNIYTIKIEEFDLPAIEVEISKGATRYMIMFNVISDGWQSSIIQENYFAVFDKSFGSAQNAIKLSLWAKGGTVNFRFNGSRPFIPQNN